MAVLPPAQLTVTGQAPTVLRLTPQTASVEMLATQRVQATAADARATRWTSSQRGKSLERLAP